MASKKKFPKKKPRAKKAVKARPIKVVKRKKPKSVKHGQVRGKKVKRRQVKRKSKAVRRKPVAKKTGFDAKTASLHSALRTIRQALEKNDSTLSKKLGEKIRLENSLNSLLRKNFSAEKELLSAIKEGSAKKQAVLRKKISSLEKINRVYEEKKARIDHAKKKQIALKKQLQLLEKKAGV